MNSGTDHLSQDQIAALVAAVGALPDAPLAMPKQRLAPAPALFPGRMPAWVRGLAARADRGRG